MVKVIKLSLLLCLISANYILSQTSQKFGLRDNTPNVFALKNATLIVSYQNIIDDATIVIRDGIIENVGNNIQIPDDAFEIDVEGNCIYPGFIDLYSDIGMPVIEKENEKESDLLNKKNGFSHRNPHVRSRYNASRHFKKEEAKVEKMRSQGFTVAHTIPPYGIFRGQTAIISLGKEETKDLLIKQNFSQAMSFQISKELNGDYPTSLMGVVALIRQTFHDAEWYYNAHKTYNQNPVGFKKPEKNFDLESLIDVLKQKQPATFSVDDEIALIRALNIADEFNIKLLIKASGKEYRRLETIKAGNFPLIVPLNFPENPEVDSFDDVIGLCLESLMHWELAPENPAKIYEAGIDMAITSDGTIDNESFLKQLRVAVQRGLPEYAAIKALTINPARLLQIDNTHGTLEKGKKANFFIANGNIFKPKTIIEEVWVNGKKYPAEKSYKSTPQGKWLLSINDTIDFELKLTGEKDNYEGKLVQDDKEFELKKTKFDNQRMHFIVNGIFDEEEVIRFSAQVSENLMYGTGEKTPGTFFNWKAQKIESIVENNEQDKDDTDKKAKESQNISTVLYPPMEYGIAKKPEQEKCLLIQDATLWTQSPKGIIKNGDILIKKGIIEKVGKNIDKPRNCKVLNIEGKHLTPGLIDPHLHTSIIGGANEFGSTIVPETRIKDVINPNNIWIYRLLAGGLTTTNILHGSVNPIGGQSAVIKTRWGNLPEDMIFEEAKPGLKMALGENVKRNQSSYPITRMGTEQIIRDAFQAALDYRTKREEKKKNGLPYRKDIQLEVLLEVLDGKRLVHAHAYRQDEMLMLIRLAEEFGFKIQTFEHTVEGYKIANILADHGVAAIVWTDWGGFKMEAYDATIYNARLLMEQGVLTSLHSDNTNLATRMHWEAGKIAGTGVNEVEAKNLITINPAKILGVDHLVGSLEAGKHADFVIWSDHPLKGFAYAKQTWVDGRKYFDRQEDQKKRKEVLRLKNELSNKVLNSN